MKVLIDKIFIGNNDELKEETKLDIEKETNVGNLIERLELINTMFAVFIVNGITVNKEHILDNGDTLNIYPLFSGG